MRTTIKWGGAVVLSAAFLMACQPASEPDPAQDSGHSSNSSEPAMSSVADAAAPDSASLEPNPALLAAINHPNRPEAQRRRDAFRNPAETLSFFDVQPDMRVVELSPGGGWYSEILGRYLKDNGQLIAAHWDMSGEVSDMYRRIRAGFDERFSNPDAFGEIEVLPFDPPERSDLGSPGSADRVLSFRNMHSWARDGALPAVFDAAFDVLKPGGVMGIVSHRLPPDRPRDPDYRSGYIHEDEVIELARASGFELVARSEINANPLDTADHPNGVWNLPPSLRVADGDDKDYAAIGESDRFTLKFQKPDA